MDYQPKYLILVSGDVNSNKFYKMIPAGDTLQIEYGRVGKAPRRTTYPIHQFDEKYREKIRKGYQDQSHLFLTAHTVESSPEYKPIAHVGIRTLISKLLDAAAQVLKRNYRISNESVTQAMVDEAERKIQQLRNMKDSCTLRSFNEELVNLFQIIPREMGQVSNYLANTLVEMNSVIEREQDLLDVMATKVRSNSILKKKAVDETPASEKDILEAMGLVVTEISEKEEAHIKKMMGSMSSRYLNAYRVENPETRKAFREYHEKIGKEKKIKQFWHGSRNENWWSIINTGLKLRPNAVITGKMFGYGIYFANRALKSAGYTSSYGSRWANGNQQSGFLAIYDVLYGTPYLVDGSWNRSYGSFNFNELKKVSPDADCLHAKKGKTGLQNDEIIVYKEEQATIKYIVEFSA